LISVFEPRKNVRVVLIFNCSSGS